ncbi:putative peptide zinc metalloprotease protein [Sinobacterium caligoides]|uniref:Putative peptide zinc metalloprotease protein n=1 Tax=Sinobacterium caligoides TaxID=933926 RepID=A0A3N2DYA9_9GAMM|nr:efflux RND transporter periplasmic adaptor subunit [Sinobacterium caligoides]ROS04831.1 putative peptide zinc metalloprotease protein [Sinobacterium caligoides]
MIQGELGRHSLYQDPWQQASGFTPRLVAGVSIDRRCYRGDQWYVLRREGGARLLRLNEQAWNVLRLCDGSRSLSLIAEQLRAEGGALQRHELMALVSQFIAQGIVASSTTPAENPHNLPLWRRIAKNPMSVRLPLWDPSKLLTYLYSWLSPLFRRHLYWLWGLLLVIGFFLVLQNWSALTHDVIDQVLRPQNWLWLLLLYPLTKLLHELAHGVAVVHGGGVVRETGIMMMYGVPVPYVDASEATGFSSKYQRMAVDAAGIGAELTLAVISLVTWLLVEPGLISQLAYNCFWLCSLSTLLFNANPLMRFDGYYLLADAIEIPNLATRSTLYWRYLFRRYLFAEVTLRFTGDVRERVWLLCYGVLAQLYRWFLMLTICFLALKFYWLLGLFVCLWFFVQALLLPIIKLLQYLLYGEEGVHVTRSLRAGAVTLALLLLCFFLPLPYSKVFPAVVWQPEKAEIYSNAPGYISSIEVGNGAWVSKGDGLVTLSNQLLLADEKLADAELLEASARYHSRLAEEPTQASDLLDAMNLAHQRQQDVEQKVASLKISSHLTGRFYYNPLAELSSRRYVSQGEILGYVSDSTKIIIRAVVNQDDITLLPAGESRVTVRLASRPLEPSTAKLLQVFPDATRVLPSRALGAAYGGDIAVDDKLDVSGNTAMTDFFIVEVVLPDKIFNERYILPGGKAWVRIELERQTIAQRLWRSFSQLFISVMPR